MHVPYCEGNEDGRDRYYAACMYVGFLCRGEPKPVNSWEATDRPINCLLCMLRDFPVFDLIDAMKRLEGLQSLTDIDQLKELV